ncbi:MAG: LysR family transcriptional regulator [Paracoccaceae bacterium]|nr:MAG: LysR family transcriptional regulator [Paracoccaceae bacterium]
MRPPLRQIETFLAIAETGSLSAAARRLGLSQPAVSQALRDLESHLGLRLIDRTTRRLALTEAGQTFRTLAGRGLAALDHAAEAARDAAALRTGRVRLAAPPFLAATVLPPVLAAFRALHPGLAVDLADLPTAGIVARLRGGGADIGLGTFPVAEADLSRRPVLSDPMMAFAAPGTLPPAPRWADLAGLPVIAMAATNGLRVPAELGFEAAGLPLSPVHEVQGIATALSLAAAGFGIAILPGYARVGLPAGLAALPLADPSIRRDLALALPPDRLLSPAGRALADHLVRSLRKLAPDDAAIVNDT